MAKAHFRAVEITSVLLFVGKSWSRAVMKLTHRFASSCLMWSFVVGLVRGVVRLFIFNLVYLTHTSTFSSDWLRLHQVRVVDVDSKLDIDLIRFPMLPVVSDVQECRGDFVHQPDEFRSRVSPFGECT